MPTEPPATGSVGSATTSDVPMDAAEMVTSPPRTVTTEPPLSSAVV